jgi:hypothetical protein
MQFRSANGNRTWFGLQLERASRGRKARIYGRFSHFSYRVLLSNVSMTRRPSCVAGDG